jgi:pyrophosphatase PpaX
MPRLPALLFDLDGTLVDTLELILTSMRHAFGGRGGGPTDEQWRLGIGKPLRTQLREFAANEDDVEELAASYRAHQKTHHDRLTACYAGVVPTLERLHALGHPMALVTSKAGDVAARSLAHVGLDRLMDVVISAESTARNKPEPDPVWLACERLGVRPADALFVGDSPHDVLAGNAAGTPTVGALWGFFPRSELEAAGATYLIGDIAELPDLLDRLKSGPKAEGAENRAEGAEPRRRR